LVGSCDLLCLLFMIFYSVVGFLTSRLFQQYWWCYHPSFDVSPRSFYFFNIFSLISLHKLQIEEERKKTKKKKYWRHIKALIMIPQVSLERFRREKFNNTKEVHKWWTERVTWAIQRCQGSLAFGLLMWPTLGYTRSWCCWICLIEIFLTALMVSLLKLWCDSKILFFSLSLLFPY
jgi:hypothetical protein